MSVKGITENRFEKGGQKNPVSFTKNVGNIIPGLKTQTMSLVFLFAGFGLTQKKSPT
jgi:hypothetical protein